MKALVNLTNHLSKSNGKKEKTEMTGVRNKRETNHYRSSRNYKDNNETLWVILC